MDHIQHLQNLKAMSVEEIEKCKNALLNTTPELLWPDGMPASIDPKLLLIGVSYGNSPSIEVEEHREEGGSYFFSDPCVIKPNNSHFYYPDTRNYWKKLRYLSHSFFKKKSPAITENEAISLTTHLNLGTGSAGLATKKDVDELYVKWVSRLLNEVHSPDLVIFFGLKNILSDDETSGWWNHELGLKVSWRNPDKISSFLGFTERIYKYREWSAINSNGHIIRLVIWPNHPSRPPFADNGIWEQSVNDYINDIFSEHIEK